MARIAANGINLHVQRLPPRGTDARHPSRPHPTVVFIHGIGADSLASFYFTLAPAASSAGIEVIAYDQRGHGRSGRPPTGYRLSDFTADLFGLLDALGVPGPVHLVGNSFGGAVAFSYAVVDPDRVASVVMIESVPATEGWARKIAHALDIAVSPADHAEELTLIAERYGAHSAWFAKAAEQILGTSMPHDIPSGPVLSREQIQSVRCPVLAILGSESDFVDQAELTSLLPGCRIAIVPGQEHSVLVKAPRAVRDLVLAWIGEQHQLSSPELSSARGGEG